jgi:non-ribosomal peptide synthase protein (TIGR01720 family)
VLAALSASWSRVFGGTTMAVHVEGHGRVAPSSDIDVSRTVGWFTAIYPLVIAGSGSAADRLQHVRALTASVPDGGAGFGVLKYLAGDPEVAALPRAQVLVNYLGKVDEAAPRGVLFGPASEGSGPPGDPCNRSPYAVELIASISEGRLTLHWASPEGGIGAAALDRIASETSALLASWATGAAASDEAPIAFSPSDAAATGYVPLVRIHQGRSDLPPFFLVHPAGGSVIAYRALAQRLDATCYGLQAPGLEEGETPIDSLTVLADRYTDAIVNAWPAGPYRLGGWSFGGVVAFEIARRLRAAGRTVALMAVLDTWAPDAMPAGEWEKDSAQLMTDIFGEDVGVTRDDLVSLDLEGQLAESTRRAIASGVFPAGFSVDAARRAWHVYQAARRAERSYRGGRYEGDLLLFVSEARGRNIDPLLGWGRFAERVTMQRVPGNHQQILRLPSVDILAARLRQD